MKCEKCKHEITEGIKFCTECGAKQNILVKCLECGSIIPEKAKFCTECGAKKHSIADKIEYNLKEGKTSKEENISKAGVFGQPIASVGNIENYENSLLKLPDLIKIGTLKFSGSNKDFAALIPFSTSKGVCFTCDSEGAKKTAVKALQFLAYRLLLSLPLNQVKFFIIDNEKNGQNFNSLFGLDKKILSQEIWDDEQEILQGLTDLKNAVPEIFTKYLQNQFENLSEYNQKIAHSNQPFQFILIANFPKGFNKESAEKLQSLIDNGGKAGVFVLMNIDISFKSNEIEPLKYLNSQMLIIDVKKKKIKNIPNEILYNNKFYLSEIDTELPKNIEEIKEQLNLQKNTEKPISIDISEYLKNEWSEKAANGVSIPIGITENNEVLNFIFGNSTDVHHALVGGATGSGKSVLLHNIIANGAYLYSPEVLQFILLDYKEGTEFKVYENLPHVKVLSIASEKEFGLSVLEFLVEEISRRGDLFKKQNVGNIDDYIKKANEILPRYLIIIDEFQALLSGSGSLSSKSSALIEDISRRGRSFGINMILSTQSLGDVEISGSTLSNIGLRIGMKMGEMDCTRILSVENSAPVQFQRAGQAVYNTKNGLTSGNVVFQVAFISKDDLENKINYQNTKANDDKKELYNFKKFIYDGNQVANFENNKIVKERIDQNLFIINDKFCELYVGEPAYLQEEHAKFKIRRQAASNVLLAGDDPDAAISFIYHSLFQMIKQSSDSSKFYVFDLFDIDSGFCGGFDKLKTFPNFKVFDKAKPMDELLDNICEELDQRIAEERSDSRIVLSIINIQRIREMKKETYDLSPLASKLAKIIKDGPEYGIHCFMHVLSYNALMDCFENKILSEFENMVVLNAEDPSKYCDELPSNVLKIRNSAFLISPNTRYKADLIKIYEKPAN